MAAATEAATEAAAEAAPKEAATEAVATEAAATAETEKKAATEAATKAATEAVVERRMLGDENINVKHGEGQSREWHLTGRAALQSWEERIGGSKRAFDGEGGVAELGLRRVHADERLNGEGDSQRGGSTTREPCQTTAASVGKRGGGRIAELGAGANVQTSKRCSAGRSVQ